MYARFFRWASDRIHDDGVIAFITNRSFIESRTFDGFRKSVAGEFNEIYVMDLGGDVRANPKLSGTKHNVFGIQTGVAISFFVKRHKQAGCKIFYARRPEMETAEDKLAFLGDQKASAIEFDKVKPDDKNNWINQTENNWDSLIPVADKKTKSAKKIGQEKALIKVFSLGTATNRDEWAYDLDLATLNKKSKYFADVYTKHLGAPKSRKFADFDLSIKWNSELEASARKSEPLKITQSDYGEAEYRPFVSAHINYHQLIIHRYYAQKSIFPSASKGLNLSINIYGISSDKPLAALASVRVCDLGYLKQGNGGTFSLPRFRYGSDGTRIDNVTDWGLKQFQTQYEKGEKKPKRRISKDDIFHYVYGVLHDPVYRETYAINLKREFPRVPFYPDFWAWAEWGKQLMELHIGYETVKPWPLKRHDQPPSDADAIPKLKADKENGTIILDSCTTLSGIPAAAWDYRLGNRSGLEWILDQYKEKKPKDPTIAAKFNTYRFKDYKEKVIDLLSRVTRVSVETMEIVNAMRAAKRT